MIALRVVLAAIVTLFGGAWLLTAHIAAQCASGLGQFAQVVDQRTAAECSQYSLIHSVAGVLALVGAVGLAVALVSRRQHAGGSA